MNIVISLDFTCAGGDHIDLGVVVDGGQKRTIKTSPDALRGPIEDREALILGLAKLACTGLTKAQARNKMQAGVNITL